MSMRLARNSTLRVAVALLIGLLCLWLSLRGVPLAALRDQMLRVSPSLVALAVLCVVLVAAGKALRWQWLYGAGVPPRPWLTHFAILMIGQMLNLVIPIRIGELARLGLMRQEERPLGVTFGTIVVEKALDLLALGLIVLLAVPLALLPDSLRRESGAGGLLLGAAVFAGLLLLGRYHAPLLRRLARMDTAKGGRLVTGARRGAMAVLRSFGSLTAAQLARVAALTAGVWLLSLVTMQVMLAASGLALGWGAALALMLALTSSNWAPTPPAMIGIVGAVTVAVLAAFEVDQARALALGTILNVVLVGPPVILGSIALTVRLWRLGETLTLRSLRRAAGLGAGADGGAAAAGEQEAGLGDR